MTRLSTVWSRSRETHRRHATERAVARALATAPTWESAHELTSLAAHQ
jgi:hypothetical protein